MNKEKKITSVLNSLEGMERATPQPFFFTRLQARMQNTRDAAERVLFFLSRPAVGIAAVALIILINAVAIMVSAPEKDKSTTSATSTEIASVEEYSQMNTTFIDAEK